MKLRKRIIYIFLLLILLLGSYSFAYQPDLASHGAILVEGSTGKILYEKNAYEKMYPASTTKVMTAILTLEPTLPTTSTAETTTFNGKVLTTTLPLAEP